MRRRREGERHFNGFWSIHWHDVPDSASIGTWKGMLAYPELRELGYTTSEHDSDMSLKCDFFFARLYNAWPAKTSKGSCLVWMEERILGFHKEWCKGKSFGEEFVECQLLQYYNKFHYTLSFKQEPQLPCRNPNAILTLEEEQYKVDHAAQMRGVLWRWWEKYIATLNSVKTSKPDFALANLLTKVTGSAGQEPFEELAVVEKAETQRARGGGKGGREQVARKSVDEAVSDEGEKEAKMSEKEKVIPIVLENIGSIAWPWMETLGESLFANITLFITAPHPAQGGQIDGILLNYGWNCDPRPKDWSDAGRGKAHDKVMAKFIAFAKTCFKPKETPANLDPTAASLKEHVIKSDTESGEKKNKRKKRAKRAKESTGSPCSAKKSKMRVLQDVTNTSGMSTTGDKTNEVEGRKSALKKASAVTPAKDDNAVDSEVMGGEWPENLDPALQQEMIYFMLPPRNDGHSRMDREDVEMPDGSGNVIIPSSSNDPLQDEHIRTDGEDVERPDGSNNDVDPSSSSALNNGVPSDNGGDLHFPLTIADVILLERKRWPKWFGDLVAYLEGYDHGVRWKDVLGCLMVWEGRRGFKDLKGAKHGLLPTGCPTEVGPWIKNYRELQMNQA
ncbi:hypothetical protein EDD85DRAFT_791122 [Armillaria nabsnona]|nr:hypothetical protein EDD85DRAFT_791122 [Armillaria nabsnona]